MHRPGFWELVGFGANGWGYVLVQSAIMTVLIAGCAYILGAVIGTVITWAKLSKNRFLNFVADFYTTLFRGVPDLLILYLFYFGGSQALTAIAGVFGNDDFISLPLFLTGVIAIGIISAAYQAEVYRGAYLAIMPGEIEAARSVGMHDWLIFRRIIVPQALRFAIPGMGNTWQLILKESALVSVIGLVELLGQAKIAAGSTRRPFDFYITAGIGFLIITWLFGLLFQYMERRSTRGLKKGI